MLPVSDPRASWFRRCAEDRGSASTEFVLVAALLTTLTVAVIQVALALHVRNTLADAAAEGARYASLADSSLDEGAARSAELIRSAIGDQYTHDISAGHQRGAEGDIVVITVRTPLPLVGLLGPDNALEVVGRAPTFMAE